MFSFHLGEQIITHIQLSLLIRIKNVFHFIYSKPISLKNLNISLSPLYFLQNSPRRNPSDTSQSSIQGATGLSQEIKCHFIKQSKTTFEKSIIVELITGTKMCPQHPTSLPMLCPGVCHLAAHELCDHGQIIYVL